MQLDLDTLTNDYADARYGTLTIQLLMIYARQQQEEIRRLKADIERLQEAADVADGVKYQVEAKVAVVTRELAVME